MTRTTLPLRSALTAVSLAALSACVFTPTVDEAIVAGAAAPTAPDPAAPRLPVLSARHFEAVSGESEVLGEVQVLFTRYENTFVEIARRHDLGYEELRQANPDVDAWLPGEGTPVYLPTMTVLPDAPREGIVLNLPAMRLLYFTPADSAAAGASGPAADDSGEVSSARYTVTSHPIGIGREGWATPTGAAEVVDRARDPAWYPPASVRAEHAAAGDPLPSVVPPGPDNPLGAFALKLSLPGYLIHGTNKPDGVGMRVSHGCIRLFPEDIEALFERVPRGTPVHIVDQPVIAGWRDGQLYLEVHQPLAEDERDLGVEAGRVIAAAFARAGIAEAPVDEAAVARIVAEKRGVPFPVLARGRSLEQYLASSRLVENDVPIGRAASVTARLDTD